MNSNRKLIFWIHWKRKIYNVGSDPGIFFISIVFLSLTLPFILSGNRSYDFDHTHYHLPSILQIKKNWPTLDISKDSLSAIAPGYYYFLATITFLTDANEQLLRLINCIISLLIPLSLYIYARKSLSRKTTCLIVIPLVTSNFFVKSAWWLFTDNAALLLVLWAFLSILDVHDNSIKSIRTGLLASTATFTRQLHIWLIVPSLLKIVLINSDRKMVSFKATKRIISSNKHIFISLLAVLSPVIILLILYYSWGGLVPPIWKEASLSISFAPIAYILSVWGFLGFFYLSTIEENIKDYWNNRIIIGSFVLGLIISIISPTTFSKVDGRWGGYFWEIVKYLPQIFDRSIFFMIFAPLGSCIIAIFYLKMRQLNQINESLIWLSSIICWAATFLVNRQIFHRYYEPIVLIFIILAVCLIKKNAIVSDGQRIPWYLMVLIVFQSTITLIQSR